MPNPLMHVMILRADITGKFHQRHCWDRSNVLTVNRRCTCAIKNSLLLMIYGLFIRAVDLWHNSTNQLMTRTYMEYVVSIALKRMTTYFLMHRSGIPKLFWAKYPFPKRTLDFYNKITLKVLPISSFFSY